MHGDSGNDLIFVLGDNAEDLVKCGKGRDLVIHVLAADPKDRLRVSGAGDT